jgi:type I restriction modification enzyme
MGGTPQKSEIKYWNGGIKWLTIGDYSQFDIITETKDKITELGVQNSSTKLVEAGSVVVSIYATIGRVGILGCDMATNQAIVGVKPFQIYNRYLMYAIDNVKNTMLKLANKTTQKNINLEILKHILIPLPPLPEQKRIVAKIEELLKFVDILQSSLK